MQERKLMEMVEAAGTIAIAGHVETGRRLCGLLPCCVQLYYRSSIRKRRWMSIWRLLR